MVSVEHLLEMLSGEWVGRKVPFLSRMRDLKDATSEDLAVFFSARYAQDLVRSRAGAILTGRGLFPEIQKQAPQGFLEGRAWILVEDPYYGMAVATQVFAEAEEPPTQWGVGGAKRRSFPSEIHPAALVSPRAQISGEGVRIGPFVVIEDGARVDAGAELMHGCTIGAGSHIGEECVLFPRVTLYPGVVLGKRVRLHAGVVLGSDGFGYAPLRSAVDGNVKGRLPERHQKIYHFGRVVLGDDVEVGALSMIDRGTFGDTTVGSGAKIDNHVHLGHNVRIGRGAVLCGGVVMAGSSSVGDFATIGGLSAITNQVHVGDGTLVGGMSGVSKSLPPHSEFMGNPIRPRQEYLRIHAFISRLFRRQNQAEKGGDSEGVQS
jgi:UDP-3-O-[3-hydroxymyristoyl] glucosamine N-acyltransferase